MSSPDSPAERYAASRQRREADGRLLWQFRQVYGFDLDDFQVRACRALAAGHGVLVTVPTGAGKTVVGEFAVHCALEQDRLCIYTTPTKALSNQKYNDLAQRYSAARVGLLTGDNSINAEAPVVVMTTEVLRNMLGAGSLRLGRLAYVVLDEVHYLADQSRGTVWEEILLQLPEPVQVVALSATVSNAGEFGDWIRLVRGSTTVITDETRPVPLWQHMLVGRRLCQLLDRNGAVNPELRRLRQSTAARRMQPSDVIEYLEGEGLLPAITFIFSRASCDAAVQQCLIAGLRLTVPDEAVEITDLVSARMAWLDEADREVLGYYSWLTGLQRGIAAHHAGMLPAFRETVEELFAAGLIRAVFATETLALGINMPARTVVLEKLDKWNGETRANLTAGEYAQLTGRAGRRGIDVEGHAVVLWRPDLDPLAVAGLVGARAGPLNSSFRLTYNMAVTLISRYGRDRAVQLVQSSFYQFQADQSVAGLARQAAELRGRTAGLAVSCERGDIEAYDQIRRDLSELERDESRQRPPAQRTAVAAALEMLRPGDVIVVPGGRQAGLAIVLQRGGTGSGRKLPLVLSASRKVKRLSLADFPEPVSPVDRIGIPPSFRPDSPAACRDLISAVRRLLAGRDLRGGALRGGDLDRRDLRGGALRGGDLDGGDLDGRDLDGGDLDGRAGGRTGDSADAIRRRLLGHPCHGCADMPAHLRDLASRASLVRETDSIEQRVFARAGTLGSAFGQVCAVLEQLGYLAGEELTAAGRRLAMLHTDLDLLAAECLRRGAWAGLAPADLAACASVLTFDAGRPDVARPLRLPPGLRESLTGMEGIWSELSAAEQGHRLSLLRRPDLSRAWIVHAWASGTPLGQLVTPDLSAGDLVRVVKQVIDLLGQLAAAEPGSELAASAHAAVGALRRGIVTDGTLAWMSDQTSGG